MTAVKVNIKEFNAVGEAFPEMPAPPPMNGELSAHHHALFACYEEGEKGRVTAYVVDGTGYLGWYACSDNKTLAHSLLTAATEWLKSNGCREVHGPINGSTWGDYRFNLDSNIPLFPGEPAQPLYYVKQWESFGFSSNLEYETTIIKEHPDKTLSLEDVNQHLGQFGAKASYFPKEISEQLSRELYDFYHLCFQNNPLFNPISFDAYNELTQKAAAILDYDCSYLLEDNEGKPIGVFIAYRDVLSENREGSESILFMKTIAVHPDWQNKFIGQMMVMLTILRSAEVGYDKSVFSLMFSQNVSAIKGKSNFGSTILRNYALFKLSI